MLVGAVTGTGSSTSAWIAVASAAIAALAAIASWRAVHQAERAWRHERLPELLATVASVKDEIVLFVENVGGGPARFASYAILVNGEFVEDTLGKAAFLAAGKGIEVKTRIRLRAGSGGAPTGALFCEDRYGRQHAWSFDGAHETFDLHPSRIRRLIRWVFRSQRPSRSTVLANFYADPTTRRR